MTQRRRELLGKKTRAANSNDAETPRTQRFAETPRTQRFAESNGAKKQEQQIAIGRKGAEADRKSR